MHPIERLRYVARAGGVDQTMLVRETAGALGALGFDPAGLVTSCRRLLGRHPMAGALWTLASRVLTAADPMAEAWRFADELDADPTPRELAAALPDDAVVLVIGWPDVVPAALARRGDLRVLVADAYGEGAGLVRQLDARDVEALDVPMTGIGAAAVACDLVLLEAAMSGPTGAVAPSGSLAAAAAAHHAGVPVWMTVPVGRALPPSMWEFATASLRGPEPWENEEDIVPADLVEQLIGPIGLRPGDELRLRCDGPVAPELLRGLAAG